MTYPTIEQVELADRIQLARWLRFLSSPGNDYIGTDEFAVKLESEKQIMDRIVERFHDAGGMTPEISKQIGW